MKGPQNTNGYEIYTKQCSSYFEIFFVFHFVLVVFFVCVSYVFRMLFILFFKSCVDFMPRFWFHVNQINVFNCVSADDDSTDDDFEVEQDEQDVEDKGQELRNNIQGSLRSW